MEKETTSKIVPLFPLPATVLFPDTYLPLHIFEPRYREMVRNALNGSRTIGMVLLRENWESDYHGNPPIHDTGCAGKIVQVQRLKDGRFNLVLCGLWKFRIREQFFGRSYRQAIVDPEGVSSLKDDPIRPSRREELKRSLEEYGRFRGWTEQVRAVLRMKLDDRKLIHVLSAELDLSPAEKQFLLESETLDQQCGRLIDFLGFMSEERRERNRSRGRKRFTD